MLGCHAATEKSFHALSHEMQFFTAASSVTDRNFLLNRGVERGGCCASPEIAVIGDSRHCSPPGYVCYVLFWNFLSQSVDPCAGRLGKENQPTLLRDLAQAHTLLTLAGTDTLRARAQSRLLSHRREVWRPDQRGHRKPRSRISGR